MISIVWQGDNRYNVYSAGKDIGCLAVSQNSFHDQHAYLNLGLYEYDPAISRELFSRLRQELGRPLQVMCYFAKEMHDFLTAGGFERKRRCYEVEATAADLIAPVQRTLPLELVQKGSAEYGACCELLYGYYQEVHRAVSPLTVNAEAFQAVLPEAAICFLQEGRPVHAAFVEAGETGYEVAYVCTACPWEFLPFAKSLLSELFQKRACLYMECDDCDFAAMEVKNLFRIPEGAPYDTYIIA